MADSFSDGNRQVVEGFIRQRRNLIITSVALIVANYTDLSLKQLNILGNVATMNQPLPITPLLLTLVGYFLLRYYVYFRDLQDNTLASKIQQDVREGIKKHLLKTYPPFEDVDIQKSFLPSLEITSKKEIEVNVSWPNLLRTKVSITNIYNARDKSGSYTTVAGPSRELEFIAKNLWRYYFVATLYGVTRQRYFTEYYFPLIMAIAALWSPVWIPFTA